MTHKYGRAWILIAVGLLASSLALPTPVLGSDPPADVVLDGVVTIHHVDADGPIAGATITLSSYRDAAAPIQVLTATTDAAGNASISGVARPAEGASAVWLDVRSDLATSLVDAAGCTETSAWSATATAVAAAPVVDITLASTAKSIALRCPEPGSDGAVLAATGRPHVTPPATDSPTSPDRSPAVPAIGAVLALIAVLAVGIGLTPPARRVRGG